MSIKKNSTYIKKQPKFEYMSNILKTIIFILLVGLYSCDNEDNMKSQLGFIQSDKYYSAEIMPANYLKVYGKWKLYNITGGFSGSGYAPDYDYLEIKNVGIYGLFKNNSLFEYGKIELNTFDINTANFLQIKLIPDYYTNKNPYHTPYLYIDFHKNDSLDLISPCCDLYNYHYKRIK